MTKRISIFFTITAILVLMLGCANWMYNSPKPQFHIQVSSGQTGNTYDSNLDQIEVFYNQTLIGETEKGGYLKLIDATDELGDDYLELKSGDLVELKKDGYYAFKRITDADIEQGKKYRKFDPENFEVVNDDNAANFIRLFIVENYSGLTFFYPSE